MTDNRYGTRKYNTGKYGASSPAFTTLLWALEVDWDNDGIFDGSNEAEQLLSFSIERGRPGLFTTAGSGEAKLARNRVGTATFVLDNTDRRYDPYYASGSLYPNVAPGRDVKFRVKNGSAGSTYSLFRGMLDDIDSKVHLDNPKATLVASDGWRLLSDRKAITSLREDGTTDQAIDDILTAVSWPSAWGSSLGVGSDTIPYAWADNQPAYNAIHELVESEMGLVYIAGNGELTFKSRHDLIDEAAAFTLDQSEVLNDPNVSKPWDFIKNKIRVQAYPRVEQSVAEIWRLRETPLVTPGESFTVWAEFQDDLGRKSPATSVVMPVASTDYTMNSDDDGGGTDRTSDFTVTVTTYAASAKFVVTNDGANAAYITLLKIRGNAVKLVDVTAYIAEDSSSQTSYGIKQLTLELPYQQRALIAKDYGDWLVNWMKDPLPFVTVEIVDRPTIQFAYDLGAYLTFQSAYLGIDRRFRICKASHKSLKSMQSVKTTWLLEPVDDVQTYWLVGTVGYSEIGSTTYVGY